MEDNEKSEYICPLTLYYMEDPVLASDGHIYEKDAIMKWYNTDAKHLSPMNRETLNGEFKEQKELKIEIDNYLKENNIDREKKDIVFDLDVVYISCVNCNQKLKIINKEHKFYRCGNPNCRQIFTILDSRKLREDINNFRENYGYSVNTQRYVYNQTNQNNYTGGIIYPSNSDNIYNQTNQNNYTGGIIYPSNSDNIYAPNSYRTITNRNNQNRRNSRNGCVLM
jgi:hypothetical protein